MSLEPSFLFTRRVFSVLRSSSWDWDYRWALAQPAGAPGLIPSPEVSEEQLLQELWVWVWVHSWEGSCRAGNQSSRLAATVDDRGTRKHTISLIKRKVIGKAMDETTNGEWWRPHRLRWPAAMRKSNLLWSFLNQRWAQTQLHSRQQCCFLLEVLRLSSFSIKYKK